MPVYVLILDELDELLVNVYEVIIIPPPPSGIHTLLISNNGQLFLYARHYI